MQTFRARTNIGTIIPRVFQGDDRVSRTPALQPLLRQVVAYPLSEFDGRMKTTGLVGRGKHPLDQARHR